MARSVEQRSAAPPVDRDLMRSPSSWRANPTLWLFATVIVVFGTSTWLMARGLLPKGIAGSIATLALYCLYTVGHDAAHGNAHRDRRINAWLGRISAAIEGLSFPLFRIIHLQHHAFTNDAQRDPDFVIGRQPRWLLPVWTFIRLVHDNHFMIQRTLWTGRRTQLIEHLSTVALQLAIIIACIVTGQLDLLLWGWLGPVVISGALLELSAAWVVHYPHTSTHPLESTRMFRGRLLQILMLNQNLHLVHHLWPRIPWFRYGRAAAAADRAVQNHRRATERNDT